jgi:hypothetical protein
MSAKTTGLVWDMECPQIINGITFKDYHKYVLLAYADHADHLGKNIWPAVPTIAKKTGYKDRNIQYITADLKNMGVLVEDGIGPRGTNRWCIPYDAGGAKIAPVQNAGGAKNDKSLGAIPSGAIPSGAKIAPEFKEPEPLNNDSEVVTIFLKLLEVLKPDLKGNNWIFLSSARPVSFENNILTLAADNEIAREYLSDRLTSTINRTFPAIPDYADARVCFVAGEPA